MKKQCSKCSREFACEGQSGTCWCFAVPVKDLTQEPNCNNTDCLCPECLAKLNDVNVATSARKLISSIDKAITEGVSHHNSKGEALVSTGAVLQSILIEGRVWVYGRVVDTSYKEMVEKQSLPWSPDSLLFKIQRMIQVLEENSRAVNELQLLANISCPVIDAVIPKVKLFTSEEAEERYHELWGKWRYDDRG